MFDGFHFLIYKQKNKGLHLTLWIKRAIIFGDPSHNLTKLGPIPEACLLFKSAAEEGSPRLPQLEFKIIY